MSPTGGPQMGRHQRPPRAERRKPGRAASRGVSLREARCLHRVDRLDGRHLPEGRGLESLRVDDRLCQRRLQATAAGQVRARGCGTRPESGPDSCAYTSAALSEEASGARCSEDTLEARGTLIGSLDMLIAGHALAMGVTLVTGNTRELGHVEGLTLENWLKPRG